MHSRASVGGHPIHPMLVSFPVAFYCATLASFIAYVASANPFWFQVGFVANCAGVVTAAAAAVPGVIDWAYSVPTGSPAKATGVFHMLANVSALALFAINAGLSYARWRDPAPAVGAAVLLPALGVILTVVAGWLGWKMVQTHHVGIDLTPEQERHEPQANARHDRAPGARPSLSH